MIFQQVSIHMIQAQLCSLVVHICEQQYLLDSKQDIRSSVGYLSFPDNGNCKYCCLLDNKDIQNHPYDAEQYPFINTETILFRLKRDLL